MPTPRVLVTPEAGEVVSSRMMSWVASRRRNSSPVRRPGAASKPDSGTISTLLDVRPGRGSSFSLEIPLGVHSLIDSRLYTDEEAENLEPVEAVDA